MDLWKMTSWVSGGHKYIQHSETVVAGVGLGSVDVSTQSLKDLKKSKKQKSFSSFRPRFEKTFKRLCPIRHCW